MMELLILLGAVFLGMWIRGQLTPAEIDPEQEESVQIICTLEWIGDQCYLYRTDTGEFLGQGADLEQIVARLDQRGVQGCYLIPKEMVTRPEQIQP
jgi:hypothetical protein